MKYLITQNLLYWRHDSKGYTAHLGEAGIYSEKDALRIQNNKRDPPDGLIPLNKSILDSIVKERNRCEKMSMNLEYMISIIEGEKNG